MKPQPSLGEFEQIVLLAILRLGDEAYGVTILGPTNLPATLPLDASRMFAKNLSNFIQEITNESGFTLDWKNEIFAETCVTLNGEINPKRRTT